MNGGRDSASNGELLNNIKGLKMTIKEQEFSGEGPIWVFDFLSRIVEECDILDFTEAQEYVTISQFLTGKAAKKLQYQRKRS